MTSAKAGRRVRFGGSGGGRGLKSRASPTSDALSLASAASAASSDVKVAASPFGAIGASAAAFIDFASRGEE